MIFFESETIEQHVEEEDVEEKALRIAAQRHEESHKNGEHHTEVKESKGGLSKQEEHVLDEIKKQTEEKDHKYARLSAEQAATGAYGRISEEKAGGTYGHSHASREASCSCGWRATPSEAMESFLGQNNKGETGTKYSPHTAGISYNKNESLEDITHSYSSPMDNMQYH